MSDDDSRGVLYLASGVEYVAEAATSARSVAEAMPGTETAIATDTLSADLSAFDRVIERDMETEVIDGREWLLNSTVPPGVSPFDKTLFLDSDTYVASDVSELWGLLDQYDLAVARTPQQPFVDGVPEPWGLYNCGVIAYRDSKQTRAVLADWRERYRERLHTQDGAADQPAFLAALHASESLRWFTLPRRYNVRVPSRGELTHDAKIVHGRHYGASLAEVEAELNRTAGHRVYRERSYLFPPTLTVRDRGTFRYHAERSIRERGLGYTLARALAYGVDRVLGTDFQERVVGTTFPGNPPPQVEVEEA